MFKRKRMSDVKMTSDAVVGGGISSRSDFSEVESNGPTNGGSQSFEVGITPARTPGVKREIRKNERSIPDKRDFANLKTTKSNKRTSTPKGGNGFKSGRQQGQVRTKEKLDSSSPERTPINSTTGLSDTLWQRESTNEKIASTSDENEPSLTETSYLDQGGTHQSNETTTRNETSCHCSDDHTDFANEEHKEDETDRGNYSSFLRGMDGTTGSTFIQSVDSYEKLRYSAPRRWKRWKEGPVTPRENGTVMLRRNVRVSDSVKGMRRRDMETRNSNDIIINESFRDGRRPREYQNDSRNVIEPISHQSLAKSGESIRWKNFFDTSNPASPCELDRHYPTKRTILYRENEAQTETGRNLTTGITICRNKEKVTKVFERASSVEQSKSSSRFSESNATRSKEPSAKRREIFNDSIAMAGADCLTCCRDLSNSRSPMNDSSISKILDRSETCLNLNTVRLTNRNFLAVNEESRKSCRCGNGCGTSKESTCCCKQV